MVKNMNVSWFSATLPIALLFMFRMLGLFMLIPIFSLFASNYDHSTPLLMGIAMGAYGLTQGLFQLPMGLLSDKIGRKPVLFIGFILFLSGSILGAYAHNIYVLISARALQGLGAVGSVLIASLADRTQEHHRAKSMAVIGISIAISFALAMVSGPYLAAVGRLPLIFWIMACMALFAIFIVAKMSFSRKPVLHVNTFSNMLATVIKQRSLLIYDAGIFIQHAILTSTFFALPIVLSNTFKVTHASISTNFYLPVMLSSFLFMFPIVALVEKHKLSNITYKIAVILTLMTQLTFTHAIGHWWSFCIAATLYFLFFNILEATLPAMVSTKAPDDLRGTAMGIYSSFQFLGIFVGGLMSGLAYQVTGVQGIFICNSILALLWILVNTIL